MNGFAFCGHEKSCAAQRVRWANEDERSLQQRCLSKRVGLLFVMLALVVFWFTLLLACGFDDSSTKTCKESWFRIDCTLTDGEYRGFRIGASKDQSFENACTGPVSKHLKDPRFFRTTEYDFNESEIYFGKSICDLKSEADVSEMWLFKLTDKSYFVHLRFQNGQLYEIRYQTIGLDP